MSENTHSEDHDVTENTLILIIVIRWHLIINDSNPKGQFVMKLQAVFNKVSNRQKMLFFFPLTWQQQPSDKRSQPSPSEQPCNKTEVRVREKAVEK